MPFDNCTLAGTFLYGADLLASDYGAQSASNSYALGKSLTPLIQAGVHLMVQVADDMQTQRAAIVYPLNGVTTAFLTGTTTYASADLAASILDSDGGFAARNLKICSAPTAHVRSLQATARLPLIGKLSGTPNQSPDPQCSFGSMDAQMLLRSANLTAAWGATSAASWSAQPYTHRVYIRETAPAPITIASVGSGRRWSDGMVARSCADYRNAATGGRSYAGLTGTGVYSIKPDPTRPEFDALCEMDADGGGWTLVQRTVWDWSSTGSLMTGFDDFYTKSVGDFGAAYRMAGVLWPGVLAKGDILLVSYIRKANTGTSCLPLYHKGVGGKPAADQSVKSLTITGLVASAPILNGVNALSSADSGPSTWCVSAITGVPWFYYSCCSVCPTVKYDVWDDAPHPSGSIYQIGDLFGHVSSVVCGTDPPETKGPLVGVNAMEYYFR